MNQAISKQVSYWDRQSSSLHSEDCLKKLEVKAREHANIISLFFPANTCITDIGCGFGELLKHLRDRGLAIAEASDISSSALERSKGLISGSGIRFIECDAISAISTTRMSLGIMTASANQYMPPEYIGDVISAFIKNKSLKGLILFDCIDPIRYLFRSPLLSHDSTICGKSLSLRTYLYLIKSCVRVVRAGLKARSLHKGYQSLERESMGYGYCPFFWRSLEDKCPQLMVTFFNSALYDYRYHVVIIKR